MAEKKIYRIAYQMGADPDPRVYFSEWVTFDGMDNLEASTLAQVFQQTGDLGEWVEPTIVGWEEKELDTEPF